MPLRRRAATLTAVSATALLTLAAPVALAATPPAAGLTHDGGWRRPAPTVAGRPFAYRADAVSARVPETGGTDLLAVRGADYVLRLDGLGAVGAAGTTASAASASSSATPSPSASASAPAKDKKKGGGSGLGNWLTAAVFFVASVGVGFLLSGRRRRQR